VNDLDTTDKILKEIAFLADKMRRFSVDIETMPRRVPKNALMAMVLSLRAWESDTFLVEEAKDRALREQP